MDVFNKDLNLLLEDIAISNSLLENSEEYKNMYLGWLKVLENQHIEDINKNIDRYSNSIANFLYENISKVNKDLGNVIPKLKAFVHIGYELNNLLRRRIQHDGKVVHQENFTPHALCEIIDKACEISLEMIVLIENGFPYGANARWRTLFEYSVVAHVLSENNDDELTLMFLKHDIVTVKKVADSKNALEDKSNIPDFTEEYYNNVLDEYNLCITKYGKNFKNTYGWYKNNPCINFKDLCEKYGMAHRQQDVSLSHGFNHGSSVSISDKKYDKHKFELVTQNIAISLGFVLVTSLIYFLQKEENNSMRGYALSVALSSFVESIIEEVVDNVSLESAKTQGLKVKKL